MLIVGIDYLFFVSKILSDGTLTVNIEIIVNSRKQSTTLTAGKPATISVDKPWAKIGKIPVIQNTGIPTSHSYFSSVIPAFLDHTNNTRQILFRHRDAGRQTQTPFKQILRHIATHKPIRIPFFVFRICDNLRNLRIKLYRSNTADTG